MVCFNWLRVVRPVVVPIHGEVTLDLRDQRLTDDKVPQAKRQEAGGRDLGVSLNGRRRKGCSEAFNGANTSGQNVRQEMQFWRGDSKGVINLSTERTEDGQL